MKFLYILGVVISSYYFIRWRKKNQKLLLVYSSNKLSKLFHLVNINYFQGLQRPLLFFSGHVQTFLIEIFNIFVRLFRKIFKISKFRYEREIFDLSDNAKIAIDHAKPRESAPRRNSKKNATKKKYFL
jgi:predicted alpha/beta-fold hydrolase